MYIDNRAALPELRRLPHAAQSDQKVGLRELDACDGRPFRQQQSQ